MNYWSLVSDADLSLPRAWKAIDTASVYLMVDEPGKVYQLVQYEDGTFGFEEEIEALRAALEK